MNHIYKVVFVGTRLKPGYRVYNRKTGSFVTATIESKQEAKNKTVLLNKNKGIKRWTPKTSGFKKLEKSAAKFAKN
ncbi:MAG: hypothetical protein KKD18_07250 [Nanoarchaeota archaeon]|nr:hypothetical protein [Nanoarchaeota archaeon]